MAAQPEINVKVAAEDAASPVLKKVSDALKETEKANTQAGSSFKDTALAVAAGNLIYKAAEIAITAVGKAFQSAGRFIEESIQKASEAAKVQKQLENVLKNTGHTTDGTREAMIKLADSLSQVTNFDDEAILASETLMLRFTNLSEDVLPQATETALNLSQALGRDLTSVTIQLGKALNDPTKALESLVKVGVEFTQEQQDIVKGMMEAGEIASAQAFIMEVLGKTYANAARDAFEPWQGVKTLFENIQEDIGGIFLPYIQELGKQVGQFLVNSKPLINEIIEQFRGMVDFFINNMLPHVVGLWVVFYNSFNEAWAAIKGPLNELINTFWKLNGDLEQMQVDTIANLIRIFFKFAEEVIPPVILALNTVLPYIKYVAGAFLDIFEKTTDAINKFQELITFLKDPFAPAVDSATGTTNTMSLSFYEAKLKADLLRQGGIGLLGVEILTLARNIATVLVVALTSFMDKMMEVLAFILNSFVLGLKTLAEWYGNAVKEIDKFINSNETVVTSLDGILSVLHDIIDAATIAVHWLNKVISGGSGINASASAAIGRNSLGNIYDQGGVVAFARGGIVEQPTVFPFAGGTGLMGEAGPEAIMPLARDAQGRLGVRGGGVTIQITGNNFYGDDRDFAERIGNTIIKELKYNLAIQGY